MRKGGEEKKNVARHKTKNWGRVDNQPVKEKKHAPNARPTPLRED